MTCRETRELFSALADDALTPAEAAALDAHVSGCAGCRRELAAFDRTVRMVRAMDPARAPAGFVDRVLAAARPEPRSRRLARRLFVPWPKVPLEAAALLLVAGLAVLLFRGSPEQRQAARHEPAPPGPAAQAPVTETAPTGAKRADAERARAAETPPAANRARPAAPTPAPELPAPARLAAPAAPRDAREPDRAAPPGTERAMPEPAPPVPPPADTAKRRDAFADAGRAKPDTADAKTQTAERPAEVGAARGQREAGDAAAATGVLRKERAPAAAAAPSAPAPEAAPLSRTGPRTGIPAVPPDVAATLRVSDPALAEHALIALAARLGGRQTGRRIDAGRVAVEVTVPSRAYAEFVREAAALGALSIERQALASPTMRVDVRLD
jgi:hypothetical protein